MKRIFLCFLLALASSSHAETINPGDMTRSIPAGQSVMQMKDIHDIASLMPAHGIPGWAIIAASMTAAAVIAAASFFVWKKFRKQGEEEITQPVFPWVEASMSLDALSKEMANYSPRQFYFSVSEILRRYISRRFKIDAMEMTSDELKPVLDTLFGHSINDKNDLRVGLKSFVNRSDLVKFGKDDPENIRMEEEIKLLRQFVEATAPSQEENEIRADLSNQAVNGSC